MMTPKSEPDLKLEIAHILTMDVVAYSTLLMNEQSDLMKTLNSAVRTTSCFQQAEANERLLRLPTGDGMVLVFLENAEAPLECAMQIAERLKHYPEIRLRMGIHSGPINTIRDVNDRSNVAGAGVDTAQRVMDCGDAGHILVSKRVADDLGPYPRWDRHLHDLGECEVKHGRKVALYNFFTDSVGNAELPQRLKCVPPKATSEAGWRKPALLGLLAAAVVVGAIAFPVFRPSPPASRTAPAPAEKRIAVLPFKNQSAEPANAYFAEGVQDEILTRLSKISDLRVISGTSTKQYESSAPQNLSEIARQLRVGYLVAGSVQKIGEEVRINVQLINADTGAHLWAETFDRELVSIFAVESEIAKTIADQLRVRLSGREKEILAVAPTRMAEAHDAYLRGLAFTLKSATTPANLLGAQKWLREAVRLDPDFALSWALLSYTDSLSYLSLSLQTNEQIKEEARKSAETALTLEPQLGEGLLAKGYYFYACLKDYDNAVRYFERARASMPNSSRIPQALAYVARRRGRWAESEAYFEEAAKLDPRNARLLTQRALSSMELRQFPKAKGELNKVLEIVPSDADTIASLAGISQGEGDLERAATLLQPLQPGAGQAGALEIQVYQSILERKPQAMIARLRSILQSPNTNLGYTNGELRFWLGWAENVGGETTAAQESWRRAGQDLERHLTVEPSNYVLMQDLAFINMFQGEKKRAFALIERIFQVISAKKDAIEEPLPLEIMARVAAGLGEPERALDALEKVMFIPYDGALPSGIPLTPALLRLDPMFDALRANPRFVKLVNSPVFVTQIR